MRRAICWKFLLIRGRSRLASGIVQVGRSVKPRCAHAFCEAFRRLRAHLPPQLPPAPPHAPATDARTTKDLKKPSPRHQPAHAPRKVANLVTLAETLASKPFYNKNLFLHHRYIKLIGNYTPRSYLAEFSGNVEISFDVTKGTKEWREQLMAAKKYIKGILCNIFR